MIDSSKLLSGIPSGLREPLLLAYGEILKNYAERRWEPSELNGGKFCEIVYTILDGAIGTSFASSPQKPPRFVEACRALEQSPSDPARIGDRSLRILIPRILPYVYEIRNNRGVGHVGGDVDPNYSDATAILNSASWVLTELVRVFHNVSVADAQSAVDALIERKHPLIWESDDGKRVLDPEMPTEDQVLVLCYSTNGRVTEANLRSWVEYRNQTHFRTRVLEKLHANRRLEFNNQDRTVRITPRGVKDVEDRILPKYKTI